MMLYYYYHNKNNDDYYYYILGFPYVNLVSGILQRGHFVLKGQKRALTIQIRSTIPMANTNAIIRAVKLSQRISAKPNASIILSLSNIAYAALNILGTL